MKISEIILFTTNIKAQKTFYNDILELGILKETLNDITFKVGSSKLTFQSQKKSNPSHFAFNIPSNNIHEALIWLQERVSILPYEGKPIINFGNWNAEAIYFYDNDYNILEFIARKDLNVKGKDEFSPESILAISEMAIATTDIKSIYEDINAVSKIPIFDGDFVRFCALGNDEGLFILIDKIKKKWFPTNDEAFTSDFIIKGDYNFSFVDGKIKELS